jgi:hypothetical protein
VTPQPDPLSRLQEAWRDRLETISTVFGRLVYLRSLPDSTDLVIGDAALQVFSYWLRLGISEQLRDLRTWLAANGGRPPRDYVRLVPPPARDVERQLFLTDMETLIGLLLVEGDAPSAVL